MLRTTPIRALRAPGRASAPPEGTARRDRVATRVATGGARPVAPRREARGQPQGQVAAADDREPPRAGQHAPSRPAVAQDDPHAADPDALADEQEPEPLAGGRQVPPAG